MQRRHFLQIGGLASASAWLTACGGSGDDLASASQNSYAQRIFVATGRAYQLSNDARGYDVAWLPGSKSVVYFTERGTLVMQDVASLERRLIAGTLPYPPDELGSIASASDGRTLYYGARQVEANIWMVKRPTTTTVKP